MSTRSTTHFQDGDREVAIIYRHSDGYPGAAGADLLKFFDEVQRQTSDTRFDDPSYLAAKYVVFLAGQFAHTYGKLPNGEYGYTKSEPLDFLSVGVLMSDPSDIEYRYRVDCSKRVDDRPRVIVQEVGFQSDDKALGELGELVKKEAATE
jgi:hypothetical protein